MIYVVAMLSVLAMSGGAFAVIFLTLHEHADAVVAALAGRSIRAEAALPARRVRVTFWTAKRPSASNLRLRAAA